MESIDKRIEKKSQELEEKQVNLEIESNDIDTKIKLFTILAWLFIGIGGVVAVIGIVFFWSGLKENLNELGDFYSGSVASSWSLSGLFFIYVAFLGQKKQLLLQQIELMNSQLEVMYTQSELKGQKEAMRAQNELLTHQKFESTFFKLMENHVDTVKNLKIDTQFNLNKIDYRVKGIGRKVFPEMVNPLSKIALFADFSEDLKAQMMKNYQRLFDQFSSELSVYFRNLYNIIKFIDQSSVKDKRRYSNIIRAQLSPAEVELLLYNGLSDYGIEKFHPLIVRYTLLKHCENIWIREKSIEKGWYEKDAFS